MSQNHQDTSSDDKYYKAPPCPKCGNTGDEAVIVVDWNRDQADCFACWHSWSVAPIQEDLDLK